MLPFGVGAVLDVQGESFVAPPASRGGRTSRPPSLRTTRRTAWHQGLLRRAHTLNDRFDQPGPPRRPLCALSRLAVLRLLPGLVRYLRENEPSEPPSAASCAAAPASPRCDRSHLRRRTPRRRRLVVLGPPRLAPELRDLCRVRQRLEGTPAQFELPTAPPDWCALGALQEPPDRAASPAVPNATCSTRPRPSGGHCSAVTPWQRWDARSSCGSRCTSCSAPPKRLLPGRLLGPGHPSDRRNPRAEQERGFAAVLAHDYWPLSARRPSGSRGADTFRAA
ncbi:hypothetical protein LV779_14535 [Streptomyces thinghirensis]|nr:hypothetical protein [Streptomyces thinghirensis]